VSDRSVKKECFPSQRDLRVTNLAIPNITSSLR
jgi:hypothetical protein